MPSLSDQTINFTSTPPASATIGAADYTVAASASSGLAVAFSASAGSAGICSVSGSTVSRCSARAPARSWPTRRARPATTPRRRHSSRSRSGARRRRSASRRCRPSPRPSAASTIRSRPPRAPASRSRLPPRRRAQGSARCRVDRVPGRSWHLLGRREPGRQRRLRPGRPGAAVVHRRPRRAGVGRRRTIDFTSTAPGAACGRRSRRDGRRVRQLGARGRVHDRVGQRGRVHHLGRDRLARRRRYLHDQRGTRPATRATSPRCRCSSRSPSRRLRRRRRRSASPRPLPARRSTAACRTRSRPGRLRSFGRVLRGAEQRRGLTVGATVSLVGAGTCTVNANQAGNGSYLAAPQVQQSFVVARAPQTITFTSTPPVVNGNVLPLPRLGRPPARA